MAPTPARKPADQNPTPQDRSSFIFEARRPCDQDRGVCLLEGGPRGSCFRSRSGGISRGAGRFHHGKWI